MKKLFAILLLTMMLFALAIQFSAFAEYAAIITDETVITEEPNTDGSEPVIPREPYSWEYLASVAGATAATLLIVQFLKVPLDRVWRIPTRIFVYVIALIILIVAMAFTSGLTIQNVLLAAVNAFIVAISAYGAYEITFAKLRR